jgi:hypothetical protein
MGDHRCSARKAEPVRLSGRNAGASRKAAQPRLAPDPTENDDTMNAQVHEGHHPRRLIRDLGVILFAAAAGAGVAMAWMHSSIKEANVEMAFDKMRAPLAMPGNRRPQTQTSTASTSGDTRVRAKCVECGVEVSARRPGQLGGGVYPGAVVGLASAAVTPDRVRGDVRAHALRIDECRGGYWY